MSPAGGDGDRGDSPAALPGLLERGEGACAFDDPRSRRVRERSGRGRPGGAGRCGAGRPRNVPRDSHGGHGGRHRSRHGSQHHRDRRRGDPALRCGGHRRRRTRPEPHRAQPPLLRCAGHRAARPERPTGAERGRVRAVRPRRLPARPTVPGRPRDRPQQRPVWDLRVQRPARSDHGLVRIGLGRQRDLRRPVPRLRHLCSGQRRGAECGRVRERERLGTADDHGQQVRRQPGRDDAAVELPGGLPPAARQPRRRQRHRRQRRDRTRPLRPTVASAPASESPGDRTTRSSATGSRATHGRASC